MIFHAKCKKYHWILQADTIYIHNAHMIQTKNILADYGENFESLGHSSPWRPSVPQNLSARECANKKIGQQENGPTICVYIQDMM